MLPANPDSNNLEPWKQRTEEVRLASQFVQLSASSDLSQLTSGIWRRFFAHTIDCFAMASIGAVACIGIGLSSQSSIGPQNTAILYGYFGLLTWFGIEFVPGLSLGAFALSLNAWLGALFNSFVSAGDLGVPPSILESAVSISPVLIWCLPFVVEILYRSFQESSPARATIGMRLMQIYVADRQGSRLTFRRALKRNALRSLLIPAFIWRQVSRLWTREEPSMGETIVLKNAQQAKQPRLLR